MNLKELQEAVERWRTEAPSSKASKCGEQHRNLVRIAAALTDPTPLSREVLEGIGFEPIDDDPKRLRLQKPHLTVNFHSSGRGVFYDSTRPLTPQPITVGDLWQLLLRLSREQQ